MRVSYGTASIVEEGEQGYTPPPPLPSPPRDFPWAPVSAALAATALLLVLVKR